MRKSRHGEGSPLSDGGGEESGWKSGPSGGGLEEAALFSNPLTQRGPTNGAAFLEAAPRLGNSGRVLPSDLTAATGR